MLSRPPAPLAASIRLSAASVSEPAPARISATRDSETIEVKPSLHSSSTSPARTG